MPSLHALSACRFQLCADALVACCAVAACNNGPEPRAFTAPNRDTHTAFPIATDPHAVDCNVCHGRFDTFALFSCLDGCHPAPSSALIHEELPDYAYASERCYACHSDGTASGIDHTRLFPIGQGAAHPRNCADCHRDANRKSVTCAAEACHGNVATAEQHAEVGGYTWTSPGCLLCHAESQVPRIAQHVDFGIAVSDVHYRTPCLSCHPKLRAEKPIGADFSAFDCLNGCHPQAQTDPRHSAVTGYAYSSPKCYDCHPQGSGDGVEHAKIFPIGAGSSHAQLGCRDCHRDAVRRNVTCAAEGCHGSAAMASAHGGVGGYAWTSPTCLRCHADSQVHRLASHLPFGISPGYRHYLDSCFACHPARRADKPFGEDFTALACEGSGCHDQAATNAKHTEVSGYSWSPYACIQCHPDGRAGD